MTRYFCDKCGTEIFLITNHTIMNTDGNKTYDAETNQYLDLCNECRSRVYLNNGKIKAEALKEYD